MSESFIVNAGKTITSAEFIALVNLPSFKYCGPVLLHANAPLTGVKHFYQDEVSTRAIEVEFWLSDKSYSVKTNYPAPKDDWMLALHVAKSLARHFDTDITEGGTANNLEQFDKKYNAQWATKLATFGAEVLLDCELREGSFATLECAVRPFYFGKRVHREVTNNRSAEHVHAELFSRIHATQYVGAEYFVPKQYEIVGTKKTFFAFGPGVKIVTPFVQFVSLPDENQRMMFVPYADLPLIMGERLSWLDEKQALIEPVSKSKWCEILKIATQHKIDLQSDMNSGVSVLASTARLRYDLLVDKSS